MNPAAPPPPDPDMADAISGLSRGTGCDTILTQIVVTQLFQKRCRGVGWRLWLLVLVALSATAADPKRVLILDPFERDVAPFSTVAASFRSTLARDLGEPVDFYEFPLDLARFAGPEGEGPLVAFLEGRLKNQPVDLVVPVGSLGVQFAARYRERLFPDTPVLVLSGDPRMIPPGFLQTNATLVNQKVNPSSMVEDILQLQPQTTNIAVVFGASTLETFWVNECRREFQSFTNRVGFTWLNGLSLDEIAKRCAALPPRSFILHVLFVVDGAGVPCEKDEALRRLHRVANAPVFGFFASELGQGPIGGRLYQDAGVGAQGARTAIRILRGERPQGIPPQVLEATAPVYDWRELQRWDIPETRLPAGSIVQFREPTLWERYRGRIIAILALCLAEAALIVLLVVSLAKQRRAAQAWRESETRFSLLANTAPVLIWVAGPDRLCNFFNQPWLDFTGRPLEQELGNGWTGGIHPEDLAGCLKIYNESFDARLPFTMDYRLRRRDGQYRWITDHGVPRYDARRNFLGYIGSCVDVTERRQAEVEIHQKRAELAHVARVSTLGALAGTLAHELNQPLNAILNNAQAGTRFLAGQTPDLTEVRGALEDIAQDTRRASEVIRQIRALVRKDEPKFQSLNLNRVVDEVVRLLHGDRHVRKVRIGLELAPSLPLAQGDSVQVQQVVLNLLLNAFDAMKDVPENERTVLLRTQQTDAASLQVSISDRGTGVSPERLANLFEPFHSSKREGLGLGLSISHSIIAAHGGRLWAENNPGRGATFHFTLPAHEVNPKLS
jgi:PAS domain S-box-containing protein